MLTLYPSTPPTVPYRLQPASDPRFYCSRVGFRWTRSRQRLAGGWLRYVHNTVSCHHCGAQHSVTEGDSSSRSSDVPANLLNYLNDPSLTGSSSHGSRPQGSGWMISFHTHGPSPVSYSKPPERPCSAPSVHKYLLGRRDYRLGPLCTLMSPTV